MWYVSEGPSMSHGGPDHWRCPSLCWWLKSVVMAFFAASVSKRETYAVLSDIARSPGHTVRSRLAPSTMTVFPTSPTAPVLSQFDAGAGGTRPWLSPMMFVWTVYAPPYHALLRTSSFE